MARRLGATDALIEDLAAGRRDGLSPGDAAAIVFAEKMTPTGSTASDAVYEELARYWSPAQVVEITAVIALFNYFNRFAEALHVPVTR